MASIRKRGKQWQVRVSRKGFNPINKSFHSRNDADRWARQTEARLDQGAFVDTAEAQRTTMAEVIERYRVEVTPSKKGTKQEGYRLNVLSRSKLAKMALASVRSQDIANYRDTRQKVVAANTVKNELNTLSAIFEQARGEWGLITSNPCQGVRRPVQPRGRTRRLQAGEEERLLASCRTSKAWYLPAIVMLAIDTGARLSELSRLRWAEIDLERAVAHLRDTKNGEDRSIPLSRAAVEGIRALPSSIDGRLFPVVTESVKQSLKAAVKRAAGVVP